MPETPAVAVETGSRAGGEACAAAGAGSAGTNGQRVLCALALLAVAGLAWLVRALPWATVFHRGQVIFAPGDAMYHVRRAFFTFARFPDVLLWDPYVNYPDGAPIPWPPLFDVVTGTAAYLLADDVAGFEAVMAWAPPFFGALTVLPVYFLGREVGGRALALAAGALFALLPISVTYGRVGNPDHHCAVSLVGATLLLVVVKLASPRSIGRRLQGLALALALVRIALLLTWHGSLLYLALAESTLLACAVLARRPELLAAQAISAGITLAIVAPILASFPTPLGGPYSSIAPSRLHLLALLGVVWVAAVAWWRERGREPAGLAVRIAWIVGAAVVFSALVLALPGPREGLEPAFQFLTLRDGVGARTSEQFPLFTIFGRPAGRSALHPWGYLAYAIPLAPLGPWLFVRGSTRRPQALVLGAWILFFGVLALTQRRYGNDLAASASVGFCLLGCAIARALHGRLRVPRPAATALVVLLALLALLPAVRDLYLPWSARSWAKLRAVPGYDERPLLVPSWSLHRFARAVRATTPETLGYLDPDVSPEYGVVAHANLGHALQWVARRPTPSDPFWAYIGPENWDRTFGLFSARSEKRALELARELQARFVVTMPGGSVGSLSERLHEHDGLREGPTPRLARFRLVTEGPRDGVPLAAVFGPTSADVPYKLFEIVAGARLEIEADPGSTLEASVGMVTPTGREIRYVARARAGDDGVARLRVPYANTDESVEAAGRDAASLRVQVEPLWHVRVIDGGIETRTVRVAESDVRSGARVRVPRPVQRDS